MLKSRETGVGGVPRLPVGGWVVEVSVCRCRILSIDHIKSVIRVAIFVRDGCISCIRLHVVVRVLDIFLIISCVIEGLVSLLFRPFLFLLFPLVTTARTREVAGGERARALSHDGCGLLNN